MVLLSSHFLEVLLKILLWWTALCTWKYMPIKSGTGKDSWILVWQSTPTCLHFSPGSTIVKKWLGPWHTPRDACPAWCTSSWEQGSLADSTWWHLSPPVVSCGPGREREQEDSPSQAGTALPLGSELGQDMLGEPQACCGVPRGMKDSLLTVCIL